MIDVWRRPHILTKEIADIAGVSTRTLRYYDDKNSDRLQQILAYKKIGVNLHGIKTFLDNKDYLMVDALKKPYCKANKRACFSFKRSKTYY